MVTFNQNMSEMKKPKKDGNGKGVEIAARPIFLSMRSFLRATGALQGIFDHS